MYNLVYKSFLSILRAFCMWITFYCLLSILYRFFVFAVFFVQVVQTAFLFSVFAFFNIATNSRIPQTTVAKQHTPSLPLTNNPQRKNQRKNSQIRLIRELTISNNIQLENSSDSKDLLIVHFRYDDTGLGRGSMYNLSVTDVEAYMTGIAYQIAGLCIFNAVNRISLLSVGC